MKKLPLNFRFTEILLLVFELNLFVSGVLMIAAGLGLTWFNLYLPAEWLAGSLPAVMTVGFAFWLVYRLRSLREARSRGWALAGATCLAIVAMSFGAAIGKLNMIFATDTFESFVNASIHDPAFKRAGLMSMLTFTSIGFIFGITFIRRAAKGPWNVGEASNHVRDQLSRLSEQFVENWDEQLVSSIDEFLSRGQTQQAVELFQTELGVSQEEAAITISDWPEHRLRMQVDLLCATLEVGTSESQASNKSVAAN